MAGKSKAPEYQAQEPAFLRKLRQENTGAYAEDGRQLNPVSIARSKRLEKDDSDDAPTYVLEEGETLTRDQAVELLAGGSDETQAHTGDGAMVRPTSTPARATVGDTIASKKRKVVKVIAGNDADEEKGTDRRTCLVKDGQTVTNNKPSSTTDASTSPTSKKRKKKAVTLSFGDDDTE